MIYYVCRALLSSLLWIGWVVGLSIVLVVGYLFEDLTICGG